MEAAPVTTGNAGEKVVTATEPPNEDENFFLTSHGEVVSPTKGIDSLGPTFESDRGSNKNGSESSDMKRALLEMEELDKQLWDAERKCMDTSNIICEDDSAGEESEFPATGLRHDGAGQSPFQVEDLNKELLQLNLEFRSEEMSCGIDHFQNREKYLDEDQTEVTDISSECAKSRSKEHSTSAKDDQYQTKEAKTAEESTTNGQDEAPSCSPPGAPNESKDFLSLEFPVTISIADITSTSTFIDSTMSDAQSTMYGSVQSSIARNISLCSVRGGLTEEEEQRVSDILLEEDGDVEKYGMTSIEEERDAEVNSRLNELGIVFGEDSGDDGEEGEMDADTVSHNDGVKVANRVRAIRGDPILRELAEKRVLDEKERSVDQALRVLMRVPLCHVLKSSEYIIEDPREEEDGSSAISSVGGNTVLTAPLGKLGIRKLVDDVKQDLQADKLALANNESLQFLMHSILSGELDKSLGNITL